MCNSILKRWLYCFDVKNVQSGFISLFSLQSPHPYLSLRSHLSPVLGPPLSFSPSQTFSFFLKSQAAGTSLVVQGLGLCLLMQEVQVWSLVREMRSHTVWPKRRPCRHCGRGWMRPLTPSAFHKHITKPPFPSFPPKLPAPECGGDWNTFVSLL